MNLADAMETALGRRATNAENEWSEKTSALPPLKVMVQNQSGNHPLCWDKRGTIVKSEGFDQYQVMIDGSRRLTRRNRRYLRLFSPFQPNMTMPCRQAEAARGTVSDLLKWAVPTAADHRDQGPEDPVRDHGHPAAVQDQGVVRGERDRQLPEPRRSTRAGRGETSNYRDFVQNIEASATYAQITSGHGGRRASLVVTQSCLP